MSGHAGTTMNSSLLEGLNPQQLEAVTLPDVSALILAGAGSGKTRVLTTRIAWLIQSGHASPSGLLAVTFTNKAAREMLTRISAMLPINTRGMWVGTFHGLCNRMLRAHHRDAALPQAFQILDSQDQLSLVKRVMRSLGVDEERYPARQAQWFINGAKDAGLRASQVDTPDDFSRRLRDVYEAYDRQCQHEGVVDFAELLLRAHELLSRNEVLQEHYRARFQHILVDEFQDTNRLQYAWLKLLAGRDNAVFAVGDDDQSVYRFRGAEPGNMRHFERDFAGGRVIRLEQNYRSHGNILDAANALIAHNRGRLGKNLWTSEGSGEPLRVYEAPSDLDEARFIVDEIRALRAEGVRSDAMAVLYRSNAQSRGGAHAQVKSRRKGSRACSSTRCSMPDSRTASMAACDSSSVRRSSTRWPIFVWWPTPRTTAPSCGSSTCRREASAPDPWNRCRRPPRRGASGYGRPPAPTPPPARPALRWRHSSASSRACGRRWSACRSRRRCRPWWMPAA
jgi:DNA helicase-2/ATP-dependent DNA helicase PcrA